MAKMIIINDFDDVDPSVRREIEEQARLEFHDELSVVWVVEERLKQIKFEKILNTLTPQNIKKVSEQVLLYDFDCVATFEGLVSQIFEKALMEPISSEMYANLCFHLAHALPVLDRYSNKKTFKTLLVNKCQKEFEKETNARRRRLGNIRFIGELYKKEMLTEKRMLIHECITKLILGLFEDPDEEDAEALCELMSTIGEMIVQPRNKKKMDIYFQRMLFLSSNTELSSRIRFMLKGVIDLRNKWQQRIKIEDPKKIEEVHRDASQEWRAQAGKLGRFLGNSSVDTSSGSVTLPAALSTKDRPKLEILDRTQQLGDGSAISPAIIPLTGISMATPNPQTQAPIHLGALDPQIQSQGISTMPLLHWVFVPILQPYPIHPQGNNSKHCKHNSGSGSEVSDKTQQVAAKKYSRDYLLKFAEQCTDLPKGFEITADIADVLMCCNTGIGGVLTGVMQRNSLDGERSQRAAPIQSSMQMHKAEKNYEVGKVADRDSGLCLNTIGGNTGFQTGQRGNFGVLGNKIEEVHRDASQERQARAGRLGHGSSDSAVRRVPINFGPRGSSMLSSPNQMYGLRGLHTQGPTYTDTIASEVSVKKYSRDFLLKHAEQCTDLPEVCQIAADIATEFMSANASQSLLYKAENKHDLGKEDNKKEANQRQAKAVSDDRLDELFSRLDNFQCYVRERLDHIDNSIASLDFQVRRLQYYRQMPAN